jgi:hypothetical protein
LKAGRGGFDFDAAVAAVNANVDPARVAGHAITRGNAGNGGAMLDARVRFEGLKARRLELENAKLDGELISRASVTATGLHIIAMARTAFLSIGHRLVDKALGVTDPKIFLQIVEAEARTVLGELSDPETFLAALEADALS